MLHVLGCTWLTVLVLAQSGAGVASRPTESEAEEFDTPALDEEQGDLEEDPPVHAELGEDDRSLRLHLGTALAATCPTLAWWALSSSVPVLLGVLAAGAGVSALIVSEVVEGRLKDRGQTPFVVQVRATGAACVLGADAAMLVFLVAVFAYPLVSLVTSAPIAAVAALAAWYVAGRWASWRVAFQRLAYANVLPFLVLAAGGLVVGVLAGAPSLLAAGASGAWLAMFVGVLSVGEFFGPRPVATPWLHFMLCTANAGFCGLLPLALVAAVGPLIYSVAALVGHAAGGVSTVWAALAWGRSRVAGDPEESLDVGRVAPPAEPELEE